MSRVLNFVIISMILAVGLVTFPAQAQSPPSTTPPIQSMPQQIPGNDAQIVDNDTTVQPRSIPQQIPDSDNNTLTEMLGSERYNSGYNHGCSHARQGGYPYLYGSGGASNHTAVFMQGYNDG